MSNEFAEPPLAGPDGKPASVLPKTGRKRRRQAELLLEKSVDGPLGPALAEGMRIRLRRDQPIFREGDAASFVYFIAGGGVRLSRIRANGRRQITTFLLPGDLLGVSARDTHTLLAEALRETVLIRLPRRRFEEHCGASSDLNRQVMNALREEISETQTQLVSLGRQTAKERVASFLLRLAARNNARTDTPFALPMSRGDMADYLGLTLETVCRTITELKQHRLIRVPNQRSIAICDMDQLTAIADSDTDADGFWR